MAYSVQVQRVTNINFLLTISVHNQKKRLWESIKWSSKGKCFDLLSNSLNSFFNKMYGDQTGEFVSGYWGLFNNIILIFWSFQSFKVLLILLLSNLNVFPGSVLGNRVNWENKTSHKVFIVILTMACISNLFIFRYSAEEIHFNLMAIVSSRKAIHLKDIDRLNQKRTQILDNVCIVKYYYINTSEIPSELSREYLISSHVKIHDVIFTCENITIAMAS